MTFLLAAAVLCVWAYFWVGGVLWAALIVPVAWAVLLWLSYTDGGPKANTPIVYLMAVIMSRLAVVPYSICRHRQRRIERTLHGVSFFSRLD
ncbi:hypothetical protein [Asaia platycodi]|uniref:hypothetical protein n=1 Tax=Asaia platycodi TaxID=610243 RepID=UPI0011DE53A9|nr:hypothetical protein [Asaia platycodi]